MTVFWFFYTARKNWKKHSHIHQYMYSRGAGSDKREAWKISLLAWGVYTCDHSSGSVWHRMMCSEPCSWIFFSSLIVKKKSQAISKGLKPFSLWVILNRDSSRNKGRKVQLKCFKCMLSTQMQTSHSIIKCSSWLYLPYNWHFGFVFLTFIYFYFFITLVRFCVIIANVCSEPILLFFCWDATKQDCVLWHSQALRKASVRG